MASPLKQFLERSISAHSDEIDTGYAHLFEML